MTFFVKNQTVVTEGLFLGLIVYSREEYPVQGKGGIGLMVVWSKLTILGLFWELEGQVGLRGT